MRGEEPSTKFYIRLDGEFNCKVKVDRGAWGEYDDNPIDVMDWQQIMMKVRKFAGRAFLLHVEIKLNQQLEMTPWTREEEECWIRLQLSYVQFHMKSGLDKDILTYQLKAYETICNSLIEYDVVLLHDHVGSIVNRLNLFSEDHIKLIGTSDNENYISTNISTVIACIDKNILTLAGDFGVYILPWAMYRDEHKYKEEKWGVIDQDYNIYTLTQDLIDLQFSGNTLLSGTGSHPSQYMYHIKFGSNVSSLYISIDSIYHSTIYNRTCDDNASRSNKTNGITHHQRNETTTNDGNTPVSS